MISECFLVPDVFFYCVSCLCCHDLVGRVFVLIFSLFVTFLRAPEFSSLLLLPSFYLAATQVAPSIYAIHYSYGLFSYVSSFCSDDAFCSCCSLLPFCSSAPDPWFRMTFGNLTIGANQACCFVVPCIFLVRTSQCPLLILLVPGSLLFRPALSSVVFCMSLA